MLHSTHLDHLNTKSDHLGMTTDWAKLKQKRATKSAIPPGATSSDSVAPSLNQDTEPGPPTRDVAGMPRASSISEIEADPYSLDPKASTSSKPLDFSHPDLPPSLSVHSIPGKGRGLIAKESFAPGMSL